MLRLSGQNVPKENIKRKASEKIKMELMVGTVGTTKGICYIKPIIFLIRIPALRRFRKLFLALIRLSKVHKYKSKSFPIKNLH